MIRTSRLVVLLALVVGTAGRAAAGVFLEKPKSDAVWTAGEEVKIEFTPSRGTTKTRVKVSPEKGTGKPYFDKEVMPTGSNPSMVVIKAPKTSAGAGKSETVVLQVTVTHTDGNEAFDQMKITIKNPPGR